MNQQHLLQVYQFDQKQRLGRNCDGGYVIAILDGGYDCYISAGVGDDESFSRDFIDLYKFNSSNSFAYDGTIDNYPQEFNGQNITFERKNIGGVNDDSHTNLHDLLHTYDDIFLKMDIEGGEFPWLLSLDDTQLSKLKQIVIEVHDLNGDGFGHKYDDKVICLEKLCKTHYLVHAHGNNHGTIVNGIPETMEFTYVRKQYFDSPLPFNTTPLPIPNLDYPNRPAGDYDLNRYPFVHQP